MAAADLIPVIAPELVDNPNLAGAITIAEGQVAADRCQYDLAVAYLAAHTLTLANRSTIGAGGVAGSVTSLKEGSLSIGFSSGGSSSSSDPLSSTSYGQEYQRVTQQCYAMTARTGWI